MHSALRVARNSKAARRSKFGAWAGPPRGWVPLHSCTQPRTRAVALIRCWGGGFVNAEHGSPSRSPRVDYATPRCRRPRPRLLGGCDLGEACRGGAVASKGGGGRTGTGRRARRGQVGGAPAPAPRLLAAEQEGAPVYNSTGDVGGASPGQTNLREQGIIARPGAQTAAARPGPRRGCGPASAAHRLGGGRARPWQGDEGCMEKLAVLKTPRAWGRWGGEGLGARGAARAPRGTRLFRWREGGGRATG
ncbi:MAG: hypothetical protein J3K34DRAFT_285566 [Monoraphidium minutum]|nr:MAG: hypothetical protein J3K34DRAFT_285566 [Monoraphidium minutum]